ncbi:flagellar biosynthesis protein FlhA [bacterium]|nr:flagellar biosynthesis protein FlhA [bacterium]
MTNETEQLTRFQKILREGGELPLILGVTGLVLLMVLPIPAFMLDIFLVSSIALSIFILLLSFYVEKPLDFSVFPTMLLFSTLLRLTLNIASTRLILLHGSKGEAAAGEVIKSFGNFVVGGNYVVGFVVFIILVIINFVVITKGAGRIAEVAARFTLDSMPGKQLAIDADLNAGNISDVEAKARREKLERESDFYGAMDGASKFVRGDAVAGILITAVNVIGGLIIGMVQEGMPLLDALKVYTLLSVGDGLVAQLPALLVSTSAGLIVTKVSKTKKMSEEINTQTLSNFRPLLICAIILLLMSIMPGIPGLPFFILFSGFGFTAYKIWKKAKDKEAKIAESGGDTKALAEATKASEKIESVPLLDVLEVEVGYDLIPIVDQRSGGEFPTRIVGIRRQFANEMGVLLPPVHIRDNLKLRPNEYRIFMKGAVVGKGELMPYHSLGLDPGTTIRKIAGIPTKDPTFGLEAIWIPDEQKESAIVAGYTVVDLPSVIATHLIEVVRGNLSEIFGRQELATILDQIKLTHPKVVNDLIPEILPLGTVLKVVQNLLKEKVSVRDMLTILEALSEHASRVKEADELTEHVRMALGRSISQQYLASDQNLYVITLARSLEEKIVKSLNPKSMNPELSIDPATAKNLIEQIGTETKKSLANNRPPVILTNQQVRPHLYKLIQRFIPNLAVLAHGEVAGHASVKPVGMIGEAV